MKFAGQKLSCDSYFLFTDMILILPELITLDFADLV